ncbi:hypothetical protein JFL57_09460 [Histophilus somni]|uniref:COG4648 family protein n=1 Tax=Histophilus somni TaxID=731 RepID=UPI0018EC702F|nr:hypothetical protein [Histophilus somni]QQF90929.1 hypothetical protein JFL57_09460 [Histophilus somni]
MVKLFNLLINLGLLLTGIGYPLAWFFDEKHQGLSYLVAIMALLWAIKAITAVSFHRFLAILMAILLGIVWLTRSLETMYWYPVIISTAMLILFGGSLFSSQSLIERFARLQDCNLSPQAVSYTRKVTLVWSGFFVLNITICTALILAGQYHWWAWYSGGVSYVLMGLLMCIERLVRQEVIKNG